MNTTPDSLNNEAIVLIVDDNKTNLQVLGGALKQEPYKIAVATNGIQALKLADELLPDIILLDIMMPEMDGYEVCTKLKASEKTNEIPVIFLTAKSETESIVQGFVLGGVDYITKPFNKEELLVRVNTQITLKRSKDKLKKLTEDLKASNATKDKMFSIIAHDLRAPFTNLKLSLQLVADNAIDKTSERFSQMISLLTTSVDEAYTLLENLLGWARSQSGRLNYMPEKINMKKIADATIKVLNGIASSKKIKLASEIEEDIYAFGDLNMISTVLRNLVNNAIKFTPKQGKVNVKATVENNKLKITVSDTGIGMTEEEKNKIFKNDVFHSTTGTNSEKGSGLGLHLCKDFVEKNNGEIWVDSKEKKGSNFIFTLPVFDD